MTTPRATHPQSSPKGVVEWLFMVYAAFTLLFCSYWLVGRHNSDAGGMPLDWFSLELVAGVGISLGSMVAIAKPACRLRIVSAVALAVFHSVLSAQYLIGSMIVRTWILLPIGYSCALLAGLAYRYNSSRAPRPN